MFVRVKVECSVQKCINKIIYNPKIYQAGAMVMRVIFRPLKFENYEVYNPKFVQTSFSG